MTDSAQTNTVLDLNDIKILVQMVEAAFKRNAYSAIEINHASPSFNKVVAFLKAVDAANAKKQPQQNLQDGQNSIEVPGTTAPNAPSESVGKKKRKKGE